MKREISCERLRIYFKETPIVQGDEVEEFWALKNVSFEIKRGEIVGIIGRNGAGKSTLLKILSRITEPTEGRARIRGRVASLLEVGTGFHPELTGRENIFLNGAILGMSQAEVNRKFDEIVAFAEIEKFIDTPVKRYSSGMYLRLAFGVAAHLEPEILIVDEVLAVGDAEFQKKCTGKIDEVSRREGRTVIFVSHNMSAINNLCSKAIYLDAGRLQQVGDTSMVVSKYLSSYEKEGRKTFVRAKDSKKPVFFNSVSILNHEGKVSCDLEVIHPFSICLEYAVTRQISAAELMIRVETDDGITVFSSTHPIDDGDGSASRDRSLGAFCVEVPAMFLMPGSYFLTIEAHLPMMEVYDEHKQVLRFDIVDTGTDFAMYGNYRKMGIVIADLPWRKHCWEGLEVRGGAPTWKIETDRGRRGRACFPKEWA